MTINYSYSCSKSGLGTFLKLLVRWRGSIYKLIYKESIVYLGIYYALHLTYTFALKGFSKTQFEKLVNFCDKSATLIPITFILGFYVSQIVQRWWEIFLSIAWPDKTLELVSCHVVGDSDEARMIRRSVARYLNCCQLLVLRDVTAAVRKRFPTLDHLVEAGFFTVNERDKFEATECPHHKYWIPIHWCHVMLVRAYREKFIEHENHLREILRCVSEYKGTVGMLLSYDWIPIPLVYTQVVTIAVYSYLLSQIIGHQPLAAEKGGNHMETFFPIFPFLQFLFYMGWLKVAETLLNPLGEDDDDFEVNYIVDRNLQIGYLIVDRLYDDAPDLEMDIHWNDDLALIPHTVASVGVKSKVPQGSTSEVNVKNVDQTIIKPPSPTNPRQVSSQQSYPPTAKRETPKLPKNQNSINIPVIEETNIDLIDALSDRPSPPRYESITGLNVIDPNDPSSIQRNQKSFNRLPRKVRNRIKQRGQEAVRQASTVSAVNERDARGASSTNEKAKRTESSKSAPPGESGEKLYGKDFRVLGRSKKEDEKELC